MTAILLGLMSGVSWGAGDFLGGVLTRRLPLLTVTFWSQLTGLAALLVGLLILRPPFVPWSVGWGLAAGIVGLGALLCFYRGLAIGTMSLVAPLSACGALAPVIFDLANGAAWSWLTLVGIAATITGIVVVSLQPSAPTSTGQLTRQTLLLGLGAALGFGLVFIAIDQGTAGGNGSALWTLVGSRASAVTCLLGVSLVQRRRIAWPGAHAGGVASVGLLDTGGNAFFALATIQGELGVAAVLASLYPVTTVVLSRIVLHERLARLQNAGIVVALAGVAMLAAG